MFFDLLAVTKNEFPLEGHPTTGYDIFTIGKMDNLNVSYAPLFTKVLVYDDEFANLFPNSSDFERAVIQKLGPCRIPAPPDGKFKFFNIFPTTGCNLRCVYCYARGGEVRKDLSFEIFKKATDFVNEHSSKQISVIFHGGGEPTLNFKLLRKIKKYLDTELNAEKTFVLQTNGVFSKEVREWVVDNIDHISLSCDGPPEIQDLQRPLKGGGRSSKIVEDNIRYFVAESADITIATVISKFSNPKQAEILDYLNQLGVKRAKFAPVTERGRCLPVLSDCSARPEILGSFTENFMRSMELADMYGIKLVPPATIESCTDISCVLPSAFTLTSDGSVSSCISVYSKNSDYNELLFGFFDKKENKIKINQKKLEFLQKRTVQNIPKCQECFMKWHCAGGCAISACLMHGRDIYSPDEEFCKWIRKVGRSVLVYKIKKDLLKTYPFIEEKNGQIIYRGVFNEFELKEFPAKGKEGGSLLEVDVDKLELLTKKIEEQNPRVLLLSFKISKKYLTRETGRKIESFLKSLKEKRVSFVVAKPLPKCLFGEDYQRIIAQFKIPKGCEECIWLYILKDGSFHICGTDKTIPQSKFRSRKDIVEVFKKYNAKPTALFCEACVYKLRGNCAGLCKQMVF